MRMTELKTVQQGVIHTNNQAYVLREEGDMVLLQFNLLWGPFETGCAEPWLSMHGVWISPEHDCSTRDMSLFVFPEFNKYSVFSAEVIDHGHSASVCLVKGDVFDLK